MIGAAIKCYELTDNVGNGESDEGADKSLKEVGGQGAYVHCFGFFNKVSRIVHYSRMRCYGMLSHTSIMMNYIMSRTKHTHPSPLLTTS
jgi:hypothetical protein